jgi:DNA-binding transcriptional LysR family regulator
MEIEYLCEFTVIAKLRSFSRAAEELCISQSSLSKHILALERELGVPLLQRNSRNVTLSPAGEQILPMAAQVNELKNKMLVAAAKASSLEKALLCIASIPVMAQYNITGLLAKFQREYPLVTLEVRECEQQELPILLENGQVELAFSRRKTVSEDLEYLEFCRDNLVAVVPKPHPLSTQTAITLDQLCQEKLLFLDSRTGLHDLCGELCRDAGFTPSVIYTGHRPENIVELAAQGMGIALLMKRHTDYVPNPNVVCVDIAPPVESTICLVRRKSRPLSSMAKAFWSFAAAHGEIDSKTE